MNQCTLCFHQCQLNEGQVGFCRARKNVNGSVLPLNYGKITSLALDPIEKKPLHQFYPGTKILSIGSFGCNLRCPFCQNYEISMSDEVGVPSIFMSPAEVVKKAVELIEEGNIGIAYTYNEPLIAYEYVLDCARLAHEQSLKNVLVTNGSISEKPLSELLPYIDAMNIDLKGFTEAFYRKLNGDLQTVKRFIELSYTECHVELTTLIIPGENDSEADMEAEAKWIAGLDPEIPLHITRFFPRYQWIDKEPTSKKVLYRLADIARKYLTNVYVGNV